MAKIFSAKTWKWSPFCLLDIRQTVEYANFHPHIDDTKWICQESLLWEIKWTIFLWNLIEFVYFFNFWKAQQKRKISKLFFFSSFSRKIENFLKSILVFNLDGLFVYWGNFRKIKKSYTWLYLKSFMIAELRECYFILYRRRAE